MPLCRIRPISVTVYKHRHECTYISILTSYFCATLRVTRLGEFSPLGRLLTLAIFICKKVPNTFSSVKVVYYTRQCINGLGYIGGIFLSKSTGRRGYTDTDFCWHAGFFIFCGFLLLSSELRADQWFWFTGYTRSHLCLSTHFLRRR
jgi:hypothetical protein